MDQQESQWTNRKQRGVNVSSPICFHLNHVGNGNADISSEEHFWKIQKPEEVFIYY